MELAAQKFRSFDAVQNQRWPVENLGVFNEPRNVATYLNRRLRGDSLKQIAEQFQVKKYSSVSSVIERMKAAIENDRRSRSRIENLVSELNKSQEQTWYSSETKYGPPQIIDWKKENGKSIVWRKNMDL